MASIIFTAKDIFDQEFKKEVRGYNKDEVNEFLDDVIKDYETYAALVKELKEENERLREEVAKKSVQVTPSQSVQEPAPKHELPQVTTTTNFDILKRLNRLEKEVFGKQVVDREF